MSTFWLMKNFSLNSEKSEPTLKRSKRPRLEATPLSKNISKIPLQPMIWNILSKRDTPHLLMLSEIWMTHFVWWTCLPHFNITKDSTLKTQTFRFVKDYQENLIFMLLNQKAWEKSFYLSKVFITKPKSWDKKSLGFSLINSFKRCLLMLITKLCKLS